MKDVRPLNCSSTFEINKDKTDDNIICKEEDLEREPETLRQSSV